MDILNSKAEEIYRQFGEEKIVTGVKNPDFKITLINTRAFILVILFVLIIFQNSSDFEIVTIIFASVYLVLFIFSFLNKSYKVYYRYNYLVFENKLGNRKIFDISKYPRIYIRYKLIESNWSRGYFTRKQKIRNRFYLYLEQNDTNVVLKVKNRKVRQILNNLEFKEKYEVNKEIWNMSVNKREKIFVDYMNFLNSKQKIIGIKDTSKNIKISKSISIILKFLICVFIGCAITVIYLIIKRIYFIAILISLLLLVLLFVLKEERKETYLEISYPSENIIKVDRRNFYLENGVMIYLKGKEKLRSIKKYEYILKISDGIKEYTININNAKEEEIVAIIDNLEFE